MEYIGLYRIAALELPLEVRFIFMNNFSVSKFMSTDALDRQFKKKIMECPFLMCTGYF